MTFSAMQSLVSQRLNEGGANVPTYYPLTEIGAALNEAQALFALLTLGIEQTSAWTVPGTLASNPFTHLLTIFTDFIVVLRITDVNGAKIRPASLEDLRCLDSAWMNSPGAPVRYSYTGVDFVGLYHQPAVATTLKVTYARAPALLVGANDVSEFPGEYHPAFVSYGIYRCRLVEGAQELAKGLAYLNEYFDAAAHYAAYVRARNLGSTYDQTPYEMTAFDRSRLVKMRTDQGRLTRTLDV